MLSIYIGVSLYIYKGMCIYRHIYIRELVWFFLNPETTVCRFWKEMEPAGQEITSKKDHVLVTIHHGKSRVFQLRCKAVVLQFVVNEDAWGFFAISCKKSIISP